MENQNICHCLTLYVSQNVGEIEKSSPRRINFKLSVLQFCRFYTFCLTQCFPNFVDFCPLEINIYWSRTLICNVYDCIKEPLYCYKRTTVPFFKPIPFFIATFIFQFILYYAYKISMICAIPMYVPMW